MKLYMKVLSALSIIALVFFASCHTATPPIIGKWQHVKRTTYAGQERTNTGIVFPAGYKWEFTNKEFLDQVSATEYMNGTYSVNDSVLTIGESKLKIIRLDSISLVVAIMDAQTLAIAPNNWRDSFVRVNQFDFSIPRNMH